MLFYHKPPQKSSISPFFWAAAREQAPWTHALTRYSRKRSLRRRAAGVSSRNRSLRSLCTRKEVFLAAIGIKAAGNRTPAHLSIK